MYQCQVCGCSSKPSQSAKKITVFRESVIEQPHRFTDDQGNARTEYKPRKFVQIEKELLACQLCYDGHLKGIPIAMLGKMHRPAEPIPPHREELVLAVPVPPKEEQPLSPESQKLLDELLDGAGNRPAKPKKRKANETRKEQPTGKPAKAKSRRPIRGSMAGVHSTGTANQPRNQSASNVSTAPSP